MRSKCYFGIFNLPVIGGQPFSCGLLLPDKFTQQRYRAVQITCRLFEYIGRGDLGVLLVYPVLGIIGVVQYNQIRLQIHNDLR
ncbi:hypothetical protein D3C81_2002800 [compost metagenome]